MNSKVFLVDCLTADPDSWQRSDGSLATSFPIRIDQGSPSENDDSDVLVCVAFGELAEKTRDLLRRGVQVVAKGTLTSNLVDRARLSRKCVSEVLLEQCTVVGGGVPPSAS